MDNADLPTIFVRADWTLDCHQEMIRYYKSHFDKGYELKDRKLETTPLGKTIHGTTPRNSVGVPEVVSPLGYDSFATPKKSVMTDLDKTRTNGNKYSVPKNLYNSQGNNTPSLSKGNAFKKPFRPSTPLLEKPETHSVPLFPPVKETASAPVKGNAFKKPFRPSTPLLEKPETHSVPLFPPVK